MNEVDENPDVNNNDLKNENKEINSDNIEDNNNNTIDKKENENENKNDNDNDNNNANEDKNNDQNDKNDIINKDEDIDKIDEKEKNNNENINNNKENTKEKKIYFPRRNSIEVPNNSPSNSIKIIKKDKGSEALPNISYDYIFKVALIGDSGTGKTSILIRFIEDYFLEDTKSTIGVDFKIVSLQLDSKAYAKMQIWDTCGSERFKSLTSSFIKTCSAFILVFDLTRPSSFQSIENWIKTIRENISPKFMILIGNKSDLIEQRAVNKNFILEYCQKRFFNYMEISAKTNNNIERMFKEVAYQLYMNIKKNEKDKNIKSVNAGGSFTNIKMNLNNENNQNKKGCCN
jgi:small GTP-binding protein